MTDIHDQVTTDLKADADGGDSANAQVLDADRGDGDDSVRGEILAADQLSGSSYLFSRKLEVLSDPAGMQSSSVGALRNHLSQQHLGLGRRSLGICSVSSDVNRTLVSASLAIAAAQAGSSTVLVDANLREPALETYFTPRRSQPGLSDYLSGQIDDPSAVIVNEVLPQLALVHAGTLPADPQSLLSNRRFDDFIAGLMRSYDFTIVDCPAARHSSDARRIASVMRYALIVAKRDVTYVSDLKRFIEELSSDRVSVVGTFLNVG